ncbi:MAG: CehA/McbA family metallohydrolase [Lachnospiraceae bacterium]
MNSYFFKRIELHNHTKESDGEMTPEKLADYLESCEIYNFSLTDHNTISGLEKLKYHLANSKQEFISGCELTTYYGHILCHNITSYIPWHDISKNNADCLFDRVHAQNGIVGLAHPCSIGSPLSNGLHFEMKIHDYNKLDFIEIINNQHPFFPTNENAIHLWKNLFHKKYSIAPVSGMDLHREVNMSNYFTTYMILPKFMENSPLGIQLDYAIKNLLTCVTKAPLLYAFSDKKFLHIKQPNYKFPQKKALLLENHHQSFCITLNDTDISIPWEILPFKTSDFITLSLFNEEQSTKQLEAIFCIGDKRRSHFFL